MSEGIKTVIYPASDLARAKAAFSAVLGAAPDMDEPYYVQFNVNGQAIGLDPHGHRGGAVVYYHVTDIKGTLQARSRAARSWTRTSRTWAAVG